MRRIRGPYVASGGYAGRRARQEIQFEEATSILEVLQQVIIAISHNGEHQLSHTLCLLYLKKAVTLIRPPPVKNHALATNGIQELKPLSEDELWSDYNTKLLYYQLLRCVLFHKSKLVRAGGLRLIRYITCNEEDLRALKEANITPLIARAIDQYSYNESERVQGIHLARHLIQMTPSVFPESLGRALIAIARDGSKENDRLLKAAQATLNELVVLNPEAFIKVGGVSCFLNGILQCPLQRINEALMSGLLSLVNQPKYRRHCSQFHRILAPMSDVFKPSDEKAKESRAQKMQASYMAALVCFRSWPGFITLYQPKDNSLQSIIDMLSLPNEDSQGNIISFLYDLFRVPCGSMHLQYNEALKEHTRLTSVDPDAWKLQEGFIVAEGNNLLPHIAKYRPNLIKNYFTLVLHTFIKKGLLQALCKVIVSTRFHLSIKATILLGELLHKNSQNMPLECGTISHALPILIEHASGKDPDRRIKAYQSIEVLLKLSRHFVAKQKGSGMSLYLTQITKPRSDAQSTTKQENCKISKWLGKDHDDQINHALKSSKIIYHETTWKDWKWTLLLTVLTWPSASLQNIEENNHKILVEKLLYHFKPSSQKFSQLELVSDRTKIQAKVLLVFCQFLLNVPQGPMQQYLTELLSDIETAMERVATERPSHDSYFSPLNINTTASQYYFLAVGSLIRTEEGYHAIHKANIFTQMMNIVKVSVDMYSKLIATSLDYTIDGENREILSYILTKTLTSTRIYATQLLRVFARAKLPDFSKWGVQLLVEQLSSENKLVALSALSVLDEALDDEESLEAVLKETPSVPHLGDEGQLLLAKIVGSPHGFSAYHDCKFISTLLDKWANNFNVKYVKLMQISLDESLTHLQRGDDGMYGRRTGNKHIVHDVFLLPHLYGSLTLHEQGFSVLVQHEHIPQLLNIVKEGDTSTPQDIIQLKAAIWALGHIGRSNNGVKFLSSENTIDALSIIASSCPVYSVRGIAFFAFCMMASTSEGAKALKSIGWETVRRHHQEARQQMDVSGFISEESLHMTSQAFSNPNIDSHDDTNKTNFYTGESDDDMENLSILTDDLDEGDATPIKSRTLPHDSRPPSHFHHKRSRSDCAPVIEELGIASDVTPTPEVNQSKKGSRIRKRILSSFRKKTGKRRDSAGSRASNSSSASERIASFFNPKRLYRKSERSSGTDIDDVDSNISRSQTLTDPHISDEDCLKEADNLLTRPPLSPIASGASLSTHESGTPASERYAHRSASVSIQVPRRRATNSLSSYPGHGLSARVITPYRRGVSESGHDEFTSKNSLRDFLASSSDKSGSIFRGMLENRMVKSPSGCSDLSSIRSLNMLTSRGSASNLLNRHMPQYALPDGPPPVQCYMGLCLPLDPDILLLDKEANMDFARFSIDEPPQSNQTETSKENDDSKTEVDNFFSFHEAKSCLHCSSLDNDLSDASLTDPLKDDRILTRKEIGKLVNSLGVSFTASHEGLKELKHRCPIAFQDVCLYMEVSGILSCYPYRLAARRLLQELFADLEFVNVLKKCRQDIEKLDEGLREAVIKKISELSKSESSSSKRVSRIADETFDDFDDVQFIANDI